MDVGQVHSFREVLPQKTVGVFVGATLPRMLRITEVHVNVGRQTEALVIGHLFAPIPDQWPVEFSRQLGNGNPKLG